MSGMDPVVFDDEYLRRCPHMRPAAEAAWKELKAAETEAARAKAEAEKNPPA